MCQLSKSGKILSMPDRRRLKVIGARVSNARTKLGLSQTELGAMIWPNKSSSASQTRIYRIESGLSNLDYETANRLFDTLGINDIDANTLEDKKEKDALCIDHILAFRFPEMRQYITLINAAARHNRFEEVIRLFEALLIMMKAHLPEFQVEPSKEANRPFQNRGG